MSFLRKAFFELVNFFLNNRFVLSLMGRFRVFDALFVMYPADQSFSDHYTFRWRQWLITWKPFIVGTIKHPSGKRTLMFAISAFVDGKEGETEPHMLRSLHERVEVISSWLGNVSTHFAGTLPGKLSALHVRRGGNQKNERSATQSNVVKAILSVRKEKGHTNDNPVVIFGALGYIGKMVTQALRSAGIQVVEVDKYPNTVDILSHYQKPDVPHVIVNITRPEAFNDYVTREILAEGVCFLNEVYPAPHPDVVFEMSSLGVDVRHIAGVKASVWPQFPGAYKDAVPCCAALSGEDYTVLIVKL